jgi:hypothetical protein
MSDFTNEQAFKKALAVSTPIVCDECKNDTFLEVQYMRRVSKLMTGASEDMMIPIPVFACSKCKHINDAFKIAFSQDNKPKIEITTG